MVSTNRENVLSSTSMSMFAKNFAMKSTLIERENILIRKQFLHSGRLQFPLAIVIPSSEEGFEDRWNKSYGNKEARREAKAQKRKRFERSKNILERHDRSYSPISTFFPNEYETYAQSWRSNEI